MIHFKEMMTFIQPHNERPAKVWSAGGDNYNEVSRGIADSIEHCVLRLNPRPGEAILDLATGTGWTSRVVARRGAAVVGVDIATGLLEAAERKAAVEQLPIRYMQGDAEELPFEEAMMRRALEMRQRTYPAGHWRIAEAQALLGASLASQHRNDEAETLMRAADRAFNPIPGRQARDREANRVRLRRISASEP